MATPDFVELQQAFTRYLRDPDNTTPPGSHEDRRLAIYRHAIFSNVEGLMADNYPRVKAVYDNDAWQALIRHYVINHQSKASAFVDVPKEFLSYLDRERQGFEDPPFIAELAHFDWLETLIGADERHLDLNGIDGAGDLLDNIPLSNPIMEIVTYQYPVHVINADFQPHTPPPQKTCIAAFRDTNNEYGFLDLNPAAERLLRQVCEQTDKSGRQLLTELAAELGATEPESVVSHGHEILVRMRNRGALLGTR